LFYKYNPQTALLTLCKTEKGDQNKPGETTETLMAEEQATAIAIMKKT
jgi:hypothetical protein